MNSVEYQKMENFEQRLNECCIKLFALTDTSPDGKIEPKEFRFHITRAIKFLLNNSDSGFLYQISISLI